MKKNKQAAGPMHFTANNEPRAVDVIGELDPPVFDEVNIILLRNLIYKFICTFNTHICFSYNNFYKLNVYNMHNINKNRGKMINIFSYSVKKR